MTQHLDEFIEKVDEKFNRFREHVNEPLINYAIKRKQDSRLKNLEPEAKFSINAEVHEINWKDIKGILFDAPLGTHTSPKGHLHTQLVIRTGEKISLAHMSIKGLQLLKQRLLAEIPASQALSSAIEKGIVGPANTDSDVSITELVGRVRIVIPASEYRTAVSFLSEAQERLTNQEYGLVTQSGERINVANESLAVTRSKNPRNMVLVREDGRRILLGGKNSILIQLLNQLPADMAGADSLVLGYEVKLTQNNVIQVKRLVLTRSSLAQLREEWKKLEPPSLRRAMPNHPDSLRDMMDESFLDGLYQLAYEKWFAQYRRNSAVMGGILVGLLSGQLLNAGRGIHYPVFKIIDHYNPELANVYAFIKCLVQPVLEWPVVSRIAMRARFAMLGRFENAELHPKNQPIRKQVNLLRQAFVEKK